MSLNAQQSYSLCQTLKGQTVDQQAGSAQRHRFRFHFQSIVQIQLVTVLLLSALNIHSKHLKTVLIEHVPHSPSHSCAEWSTSSSASGTILFSSCCSSSSTRTAQNEKSPPKTAHLCSSSFSCREKLVFSSAPPPSAKTACPSHPTANLVQLNIRLVLVKLLGVHRLIWLEINCLLLQKHC